jgi:hypothetical protein
MSGLGVRRDKAAFSSGYGPDLSWLVLSVRSNQTLPCKPVWVSRPGSLSSAT